MLLNRRAHHVKGTCGQKSSILAKLHPLDLNDHIQKISCHTKKKYVQDFHPQKYLFASPSKNY